MIVVDTDVVSELMRARPSARLVERLADVAPGEQATTAITLGEISYGAQKAGRPELLKRAWDLLAGVVVLDFDRAAALRYGEVRADLEARGERLADPDLRIASIVLAASAQLITGNLRHFSRVPGLVAQDWIRH